MTRYHKKDLVYFKKDGKPTIAAVVMVDARSYATKLFVLEQSGHQHDIWLGWGIDPEDFKLITNRVYNKLTPEQQDIVDNFDFDLAVRNFKRRMGMWTQGEGYEEAEF